MGPDNAEPLGYGKECGFYHKWNGKLFMVFNQEICLMCITTYHPNTTYRSNCWGSRAEADQHSPRATVTCQPQVVTTEIERIEYTRGIFWRHK